MKLGQNPLLSWEALSLDINCCKKLSVTLYWPPKQGKIYHSDIPAKAIVPFFFFLLGQNVPLK